MERVYQIRVSTDDMVVNSISAFRSIDTAEKNVKPYIDFLLRERIIKRRSDVKNSCVVSLVVITDKLIEEGALLYPLLTVDGRELNRVIAMH